MADLFSDEDFPKEAIRHLRRMGHDVVTIQEAGWANKKFEDRHVLDYAHKLDRAVLTCNDKDFAKLHERTPDHPGIVSCPQKEHPAELARHIHQRLQQETELKGKFVDLKTGRTLAHGIDHTQPSHFRQIMQDQKPPSGHTMAKSPPHTPIGSPSASYSRFREVMNQPPQSPGAHVQPAKPDAPRKPKP